jgi:hypothetical protein
MMSSTPARTWVFPGAALSASSEFIQMKFPAGPSREVGPHRCLVTPDHLDERVFIAAEGPGDQLRIIRIRCHGPPRIQVGLHPGLANRGGKAFTAGQGDAFGEPSGGSVATCGW